MKCSQFVSSLGNFTQSLLLLGVFSNYLYIFFSIFYSYFMYLYAIVNSCVSYELYRIFWLIFKCCVVLFWFRKTKQKNRDHYQLINECKEITIIEGLLALLAFFPCQVHNARSSDYFHLSSAPSSMKLIHRQLTMSLITINILIFFHNF